MGPPHAHFYCLSIDSILLLQVDLHEVTFLATGDWAATAFPIATVILGNYLVMNLFIAVLIQAFGEDHDSHPFLTTIDDLMVKRSKIEFTSSGELVMTGKTRSARVVVVPSRPRDEKDEQFRVEHWPSDYNLLCFGPRNPIRHFCKLLSESGIASESNERFPPQSRLACAS